MNLSPGASEEEIKHAFRKLAHRYHPDKNPGDALAAALFQEVKSAYETLMDPEQRKKYRWSDAETFHVSAIDILHETRRLEKLVRASDPYRLNLDSLYYKIQRLFSAYHLHVLHTRSQPTINEEIVQLMLRVIQPLRVPEYEAVLADLLRFAPGYRADFEQLVKKKKRDARYQSGKLLIALAIAILACLLMYWGLAT